MKKTFILASNNKDKLIELKEKLKEFDIDVISQSESGYDIEVEETGKTFEENAILKAEAIYKLSGQQIIADDSGLEVDFLNGEPGVYSHRYAPDNSNEEKYTKILKLMNNVEEENRTARFKCVICYIDLKGNKNIFRGICEGSITKEPKGSNGFDYDPIFKVGDKTFAEMTLVEKNKISHRSKAIEQFINYIKNNEEI